MQSTIIVCIREHSQTQVLDRRCANLEKPMPQLIKCNQHECTINSARWNGVWGLCTGSCGQGVQQFVVQCHLEMQGRVSVVNDAMCPQPKPHPAARPCTLAPCQETNDNEIHTSDEWNVGSWSAVSTVKMKI